MTASPRVVLIYNHAPSGHSHAALSIEVALKGLRPDAKVFHIALSKRVNPILGPALAGLYLRTAEFLPSLWNFLYDNAAVARAANSLLKIPRRIEGARLRDLLAPLRPDIVVATQALPLNVLARERRARRFDFDLAGVLTDFIAHRYWPARGVDWYAVPAVETRGRLTARGVAEDAVYVTGIPLRAAFARPLDKTQARIALGLDPETPVVLVAGGTRGLGRQEDAVRALLNARSKPTVLATTGTNTELAARLRALKSPRLVLHEGLEDRRGLLPMAADVLIGKPGGLTTSEALALGLPMVVFGAFPGQEQANARFLERRQAAVWATYPAEAAAAAESLLQNDARREGLSARALALGRPGSSAEIARLILASVELRARTK